VIILDEDGTVRSVTDQAQFWLEQFPRDRGTGLQLPVAVHAVARRAMAQARPGLRERAADLRQVAHGPRRPPRTDSPDPATVAVTLAPATPAELEPLRLALHGLTPRERQVAQLLARGARNEEIAGHCGYPGTPSKTTSRRSTPSSASGCRPSSPPSSSMSTSRHTWITSGSAGSAQPNPPADTITGCPASARHTRRGACLYRPIPFDSVASTGIGCRR
jgi:hypothetical protein